ncbi:MAG: hypothetical protein K2M19_09490 [Muribaculaceae bacterium]|nr:hypothetical protein [Muribaculaceae bacterium]
MFHSCSDDVPEIQNPAGEVVETEDGIMSSFYVANNTGNSYNEQTPVEFELIDPTNQTIYSYGGTMQSVRDQLVNGSDNVLHCAILLGDKNIPDGHYYITIMIDGEVKSSGHYVDITDNVITPIKGAQYTYSDLEGEGSEQNPYKIKSDADFEYFLKTLKRDSDRGYGRYFVLCADVSIASFSDNPEIAGAEFQGTFDGQNHNVSGLTVQGLKMPNYTRTGMFSAIFNATVKNVNFTDVLLMGIPSYGGTVAGYAKGKNILAGIKAKGQVEGVSYIGGLIGAADGQLTVSDCELDLIVKAENFAGGVIGAMTASGASDFNNLKVEGQVLNASNSGGIIGMLSGTKAPTLGSIACYSYVMGKDNVGGFIGFINKNTPVFSADCRFEGRRDPNYSVYGEENVGGFAGYLDMNGAQSFKIDKHTLYLDVAVRAAKGNAGGLLGYATKGWINVNKLNLAKAENRVESSGDCVGGVAGWLDGVGITGPVRINDKHELPKPASLADMYNGIVIGHSRVGGCIGYLDQQQFGDPYMLRGYVTGLACKAQVMATGNVVGGVIGEIFGDASHCAFLGNVSGPNIVGGVVGKAQYAMTQELCVNYADIDGGTYQGGVCGYSNPAKDPFGYDTTIGHSSCYNIGRLTNGKTVGGIVGYAGQQNSSCNFYLYGCENYGEIVAAGSGDYSVGGIAGDIDNDDTKVEWCYNYADVSSKNVQFVIGGVVGRLGREQITQNYLHVVGCLNMGTISCDKSSTKLGGVIGHMLYGGEGMIAGCVNWGDIPCDQKDDTGGILGCATSFNYISRNWNRGNIAHGNAIVGTHKPGTIFDHRGNYYLEGTGGNWPSSTSVPADAVTQKSSYPELPFNDHPDYFNWMGEHYYMSSNGPIPFYFNFVHWDVDKLRPEGWKIY